MADKEAARVLHIKLSDLKFKTHIVDHPCYAYLKQRALQNNEAASLSLQTRMVIRTKLSANAPSDLKIAYCLGSSTDYEYPPGPSGEPWGPYDPHTPFPEKVSNYARADISPLESRKRIEAYVAKRKAEI